MLAVVGLEALGVPLPGETALVSAGIYAGATHRLQPFGIVIAAVAVPSSVIASAT